MIAGLALLILVPQDAQPSADALDTAITAVTVYADQALVTREVEVELVAGDNNVVFGSLTRILQTGSVRVKVDGPGVVVGVETRHVTEVRATSAAVVEARSRIEALEALLAGAREDANAAEAALGFAGETRNALVDAASRALGRGSADPETWGRALAFVERALDDAKGRQRDAARRAADLEEEISAVRATMKGADLETIQATLEVHASVEAEHAGKATLTLTYLVGQAAWNPVYELRASADMATVGLVYHGVIAQHTGEDWTDIALSLSTARPHLGAAPPDLGRISLYDRNQTDWGIVVGTGGGARGRLGGRAKRSSGPMSPGPGGPSAMDRIEHMLEEASLEPTMAVAALVQKTGLTALFQVPRPEDIPSDGEAHRVLVHEARLDVEPRHYAAPAAMERVFLRAHATNTTELPMLAGGGTVFFGPDFVGAVELADVQPGAEFDLYLGIDPGIEVVRKEVASRSAKPGAMARNRRKVEMFEITVTNHGGAGGTAHVRIEEALPVTTDSRLKVKIESNLDPVAGEKEEKAREERGLWAWEMELEPGASTSFTYTVTVEWPKALGYYQTEDPE